MATPTIPNGEEYFGIVTWTGNNSSPRAITGVGHQPDFIWIKDRVAANNHVLVDTSKGLSTLLYSNATTAGVTSATQVSSSNTDGFTLGATTYVNESGSSNTYVAWNWKANGGSTTTNDASSTGIGTIDSVYQANTTSGFSIVQYTGTGSAGTIRHGLSVAPSLIIVKKIANDTQAWQVYHHKNTSAPETEKLTFNTTAATVDDNTTWNDTAPTSTVFSVGTGSGTNENTDTYIAYCWHSVDGFSKFGKYVGNSNNDGSFIWLGFKPSFVLIKSTSVQYWMIQDSARWKFNPTDKPLFPASTSVESGLGAQNIDLLSNGFKCRGTGATQNSSSHTYIYMAFAEHPFVGDGTNPTTAR